MKIEERGRWGRNEGFQDVEWDELGADVVRTEI